MINFAAGFRISQALTNDGAISLNSHLKEACKSGFFVAVLRSLSGHAIMALVCDIGRTTIVCARCVSFTCLFIQQNGILHNKVYNVQGMAIFVTYGLVKAALREFLQKRGQKPEN